MDNPDKLPADITAAIEALDTEAQNCGLLGRTTLKHVEAHATLTTAILARLAAAAEDDAEATCLTTRAEKAEAERDHYRDKLDEMHGYLRLAEGSCAKLREEIAGLRGSHECVEQHMEDVCTENERLREALQQARNLIWEQLEAPGLIETIDAALAPAPAEE